MILVMLTNVAWQQEDVTTCYGVNVVTWPRVGCHMTFPNQLSMGVGCANEKPWGKRRVRVFAPETIDVE